MTDETTAEATTTPEVLHPATEKLLEKLDDIAENARYAADPRKPAGDMAAALAEYYRTPD